MKEPPKPTAKVARLNHVAAAPDPERVERIRRWHVDQAISPQIPVAMMSVTIMSDGQIVTKGLCIEPEHALIMLPELYAVAQLIEEQIESPTMPAPLSRIG